MTDPKPTTNDILAKIRGGAAPANPTGEKPSEEQPAPAETPAAETPASETPATSEAAAETSPVQPAVSGATPAKPAGTADILAAARAKKPATPATPGSTADILAAARAKATPAASGEKPVAAKPVAKSPADIMSAIRGGGSAAPAAAKAPTAESKPVAAAASSVPPGLTPAEMIRKARQGAVASAVDTPPKVAMPSKPLAGKPPAAVAAGETRRGFLGDTLAAVCSPVVIAWVSFVTATVASVLAVARFMMPNVLVEPPTKFKIGPPNDYAPGTVSTKWQAQFGTWIVNAEVDGNQQIYALSTVCTHLGCTPNWLEGEQKFKCPCHGSGFYKSGVNFEGPAPRPLERFGLRLAEDGMLEVDKGLKFQKELGQWSNPACFVPVV